MIKKKVERKKERKRKADAKDPNRAVSCKLIASTSFP